MTLDITDGALRAAIRHHELGGASPYCLSYARLGSSGASFGIFQADTHASADALATLRSLLYAGGMDSATIERIAMALREHCPNGCPLTKQDADAVATVMDSPGAKKLIDEMDGRLLKKVRDHVLSTVEAAARASRTVTPAAQLYTALWVNMTGAPTTLNQWIAGGQSQQEHSSLLPASPGAVVGGPDLLAYLGSCLFFREYPQQLERMTVAVQAVLAA